MSSLIRVEPFKWPYSLSKLVLDEPRYSFSSSPSEWEYAYFNVFKVQPTAQPVVDPELLKVQEVTPVQVEGVWKQQWEVVPLTDEEKISRYRALNPPRWIEFWASLPPEVDTLLTAAQAVSPRLALSLGVGLGKAADGDSRVFLGAWATAAALGLVSPGLITTVQVLATANNLPEEFVEGLQP